MKKTYIIPCTSIELALAEQMLAGSGITGSGNGGINIGYGGVDTSGVLEPSAKESDWNIWGED